jgi:hypothetical protein
MTTARPAVRLRRRILPFVLLILSATTLASGCTEKLVQPPPPPTVFGVPDSIQEVFTTNCALSNCHAGSAPQQGMALTDAGTSWTAIVDVPANELMGQYRRIAPGDSADSYIVMKLRGDARIFGQRMPLGRPALDPALIMRVASWAEAGAPGQVLPAARAERIATR